MINSSNHPQFARNCLTESSLEAEGRTASPNERAAVLSARLGQADRTWMASLRGDTLILGCDERLNDTDVPLRVVEAARATGLVVRRYHL